MHSILDAEDNFVWYQLYHLAFAHRGRTEVTLRAGNSPPSSAGSSTGRNVLQTRFAEDAGGERWHQRTGLEQLPSSNWREHW